MKKTTFIFFSILFLSKCFAQIPTIQWQKALGGTDYDYPNCIKQTVDGGYIAVGQTMSNDGDVSGNHGGNSDWWIVKLNSTGIIQWQKTLGGSFGEVAYSIEQTTEGGYIVAGSTQSNDGDVTGNHGGFDYWVVKLSETGTVQWQKVYGGRDNDSAKSIKLTADGGYIIAGYTDSVNGDITVNHGNRDYWLIKLNATGVIQWQKTLGGSNYDIAACVQQTSDGGYIVVGETNSNDGDVIGYHGNGVLYDFWIVKLDTTGTIEWEKTYGGSGNESAYSVEQTADGGYIIGGLATSIDGDIIGNHGFADSWIIKLNAMGTIQWQKMLGGSNFDEANSIKQTIDGGYIFVGQTQSVDGDVTGYRGGVNSDSWIVKLNEIGTIQWQKTLGGTSFDGALSVEQTTDNGFVFAVQTQSIDGDVTGNHGSSDLWIVKLAQETLATIDFSQNNIVIYPNPTISILNLRFPNEDAADKIIITDLTGKIILQRTEKTTQVNVEKFAAGIYFIQVFSGEKKWLTKFVKE